MINRALYCAKAVAFFAVQFCLVAGVSAGTALSPCVRDETAGIQSAIDKAWRLGGGKVELGPGVHNVAALRLRSGVLLCLGRDCILRGTRDPRAYDDLLRKDALEPVPAEELDRDFTSRPEFRAAHSNVRGHLYGSRWNNALIRIYRAHDCGIVGESGSAIEGCNCADPLGEELYRGPHAINAVLSTNLVFRGYAVRDAGNYSHRIMACSNVTVEGVTVLGGHDGVHFRDADHVRVTGCDIAAGDDALAGRANTDVVVSNCVLNSACSPVRFGGSDVLFVDCRAKGPNAYPHRYTLSRERQLAGAVAAPGEGRRNIGCFYQYFTGEDLALRKKPGNLVFRNLKIENPGRFMVMLTGLNALWQTGPAIDRIRFENVVATGVERPSAIWAPDDCPLTLEFVNCQMSFKTQQPYAFTGRNLTVKTEGSAFENAGKVYEPWSGASGEFVKSAVPEFPSWSFDRPEADLR